MGELEREASGQERDHRLRGELEREVRDGLLAPRKRLPAHLLYDARGSRLYERITELPEYYLTRVELSIFEQHAGEIARHVAPYAQEVLRVVELGAGSAKKTQVLLAALLERCEQCIYVPIDVSSSALHAATAALRARLPRLVVEPRVGHYVPCLQALGPALQPQLALFIGSSIGNLEDPDAVSLLSAVRQALGPGGSLLLGTDLPKDPDVLVAAYDDSSHVTAAFNLNLLVRLNDELGADFDLSRFRHRAVWNEARSRIEMHLESLTSQEVSIAALGLSVRFAKGETIHTESSIKYDLPRVDALLGDSGFARLRTFFDAERRYAVHVAEA